MWTPLRLVSATLVIVCVFAGCSLGVRNTPAQDLAWERWYKCNHFASVIVDRIEPNGQIWYRYRVTGESSAFQQCMRDTLNEQKQAGKLNQTATAALSETDARQLVRYAYFTAAPPSGSYIRAIFGADMPMESKTFTKGTPVTLFYGVDQVGRVLHIEAKWVSPNGAVVKSIAQTIDQSFTPGLWTWRVQTLNADDLMEPGTWRVDLHLDGNLVAQPQFTISP